MFMCIIICVPCLHLIQVLDACEPLCRCEQLNSSLYKSNSAEPSLQPQKGLLLNLNSLVPFLGGERRGSETGFSVYLWLSVYQVGLELRSPYLCLLSAKIKGLCHTTQLLTYF